ncbi:MAG: hypothetical protein ABIA75_04060 [Candidatus Neomarinimicrobiota bacterium]
MLNRITSIITTLLLLSSPVLSLVQFDNCNMPCCRTELSCCMAANVVTCESSLAACNTPVLLTLVVAPLNKVEQRIEQTIIAVALFPVIRLSEQLSHRPEMNPAVDPEPPPAHPLPLLI